MKPYNTPNAGKKEEVKRMFDNIAPTYDRLNHILRCRSTECGVGV